MQLFHLALLEFAIMKLLMIIVIDEPKQYKRRMKGSWLLTTMKSFGEVNGSYNICVVRS